MTEPIEPVELNHMTNPPPGLLGPPNDPPSESHPVQDVVRPYEPLEEMTDARSPGDLEVQEGDTDGNVEEALGAGFAGPTAPAADGYGAPGELP